MRIHWLAGARTIRIPVTRLGALAAFTFAAAVVLSSARAQEIDRLKEAQVKAAYLVNFLRYTDFPPDDPGTATTAYRVVVVGDEALSVALQTAPAGRITINSRALSVVSPNPEGNMREIPAAELVFVGQAQTERVAEILEALQGQPVLTVGDTTDFMQAGGMIALRLDGTRVVFDANPGAIRAAGLLLSAKVLKLARHLHGEPDTP